MNKLKTITVMAACLVAFVAQALPLDTIDLFWYNNSFYNVTINGQLVDMDHNHPLNNGDIIGANISGGCPTTYNVLGYVYEFNALNQIVGQVQLVLPAGYSYGEWYVTYNDVSGYFSATFLPGGSTPCH